MNKLQFSVLASGSRGNAVAVFPGNGSGFLLDCGLSSLALRKRFELIGKSIEDISGVFITHTHGDHDNRKASTCFGWRRNIFTRIPARRDEPIRGCKVTPFALSHGDCTCHGFRVDYKGMSLAYLVDTSTVPEESLKYLFNLDSIIIESSYREQMLTGSETPVHGNVGDRHLSNEQAACVLGLINGKRLKHVVMAHVSSRLNTPAFALNAGTGGAPQAQVIVAEQDRPTKMITLMG